MESFGIVLERVGSDGDGFVGVSDEERARGEGHGEFNVDAGGADAEGDVAGLDIVGGGGAQAEARKQSGDEECSR